MKRWQPIKLENLSKDTQKVYDVLNESSDIACVLIGTSYLAELIASAIKVAFIDSSISEKLLDPQRGAVGGFVTRSDLAYCLGLINKNIYQDLIKIAEIRNMFAHKHLALNFGVETIRKKCEELKAWRTLQFGKEDINASLSSEQLHILARNQFNISVTLNGSRIHVDALSKKAQNKKR